jgi:histidyl-tRNA synthetase
VKRVIPPVKGTRDFYPEQMAIRRWLYDTVRGVAESFGYQEYEAPILEGLALYAAKSGEELVRDQSYVFTDRGGDQIALRPELTPSLARMIAQRQGQLAFPLRWWSFGPFWRYERPQRGRTREFFQWNLDLLGADSPEADAEIVAVLAAFLQRVGLQPTQVQILVGNRPLMESAFDGLGIDQQARPALRAWVDRRAKMEPDAWRAEGRTIGLSASQQASFESILQDPDLWKKSDQLRRLFLAIEALGLARYVHFDASVMRGLLYYTGTVFEAWDIGGEIKRSIVGGGRYDNLLADVGGTPLAAVGFAMGDVVMMLLLERYGLLPSNLPTYPAALLVTVFDQERLPASLELAAELRRAGLNVVAYAENDKLSHQFKFADKINARLVLVLGPDEVSTGRVTIKDMRSGNQETTERSNAVQAVRALLEAREGR